MLASVWRADVVDGAGEAAAVGVVTTVDAVIAVCVVSGVGVTVGAAVDVGVVVLVGVAVGGSVAFVACEASVVAAERRRHSGEGGARPGVRGQAASCPDALPPGDPMFPRQQADKVEGRAAFRLRRDPGVRKTKQPGPAYLPVFDLRKIKGHLPLPSTFPSFRSVGDFWRLSGPINGRQMTFPPRRRRWKTTKIKADLLPVRFGSPAARSCADAARSSRTPAVFMVNAGAAELVWLRGAANSATSWGGGGRSSGGGGARGRTGSGASSGAGG